MNFVFFILIIRLRLYTVEETRVTVTPVEGAEYDYVNANFIDVSLLNGSSMYVHACVSEQLARV